VQPAIRVVFTTVKRSVVRAAGTEPNYFPGAAPRCDTVASPPGSAVECRFWQALSSMSFWSGLLEQGAKQQQHLVSGSFPLWFSALGGRRRLKSGRNGLHGVPGHRTRRSLVHLVHFVHFVHAQGGMRGRLTDWGGLVKQFLRGAVDGAGGLASASLAGLAVHILIHESRPPRGLHVRSVPGTALHVRSVPGTALPGTALACQECARHRFASGADEEPRRSGISNDGAADSWVSGSRTWGTNMCRHGPT